MFAVGERVVCINDAFAFNGIEWASHFPRLGHVYTVRRVAMQPHYLTRASGLAVWLEEIVNPLMTDGVEPSFSAWRFAKLANEDAACVPAGAVIERDGSVPQVYYCPCYSLSIRRLTCN
jgi:hypothetical protein